MNRQRFLLSSAVFFCGIVQLFPCTTALVSGKATKDGRPLLLKNRDADELQNKLMYFSDGKYRYIGLVNSSDSTGKEVWGGYNSTGFAIMNSASYNLKRNDTTVLSDQEGVIMKLALQYCASLTDFEHLLDTLAKPLGVEANFGVIDALGGGAYYETDNFHYAKYDVNDPSVAPDGYLLRTNYSVCGIEDKGAGYIRFNTEETLFKETYAKGKFTYRFLIETVPHHLKHSLTKTDLSMILPNDTTDTHFVPFQDFIPRTSTSAAILIQGVKNHEQPLLTTMWTILGFPLTSIIIPVWIVQDGFLPPILVSDVRRIAPLCDVALKLKGKLCPSHQGIGNKYLDVAFLQNRKKTGIRQQLIPVENEILKQSEKYLSSWRKTGFNDAEAGQFYHWVNEFVKKEYERRLKISWQ